MTDIATLAKTTGIPSDALTSCAETLGALSAALKMAPRSAAAHLLGLAAQAAGDGRAASWAVRLRILDASHDTVADTDPDRPHEAPGEDVVQGLPAIATWAAELVRQFHPAVREPQHLFASRVPSLRVALTRNGAGRATWAVRYEVEGDAYIARVDVHRQAPARGVERRALVASQAVDAP